MGLLTDGLLVDDLLMGLLIDGLLGDELLRAY